MGNTLLSVNFRMNLWSHCFSQNMNEKLSGFLPCIVRAEILAIFCSYFGRNDDFINSFWNCLTFKAPQELSNTIPVGGREFFARLLLALFSRDDCCWNLVNLHDVDLGWNLVREVQFSCSNLHFLLGAP